MSGLRYGLIGLSQGFYATTYTESLLQNPAVEVLVCCDLGTAPDYQQECAGITAEEFCRKHSIELTHNIDDFFKYDLDMVMVATEVHQHTEYALAALEAGCHVFVSKPLSFKSEDVKRVITASQKYGRIAIGSQPLRYEEGMREIKDQLVAGRIGRLTNIRLLLNHQAMIEQEWERNPEKSGGPLGTFGLYLFDLIRWFSRQEFKKIYASGDNFVFPQIRSNDTIQINGVLSKGTLVNLNLITTIKWDFPFVLLDITGNRGVLRSNYDNYRSLLQGEEGSKLGAIRYSPMGRDEIYHFVNCCLGRERPEFTLEDMLQATYYIEATWESLKRDLPVYPEF